MRMVSDPERNRELREKADLFCRELSQHPVLVRYWDEIAVVLKGSTPRGYSDLYSDVDLVLFCREGLPEEIAGAYVSLGLSQREDGVFLPLHDWEGHYNIESFSALREKLGAHVETLWEYGGAQVLRDPQGIFAAVVGEKEKAFRAGLCQSVREKYLECQLLLDWLRQPLRRGDGGASLLAGSSVYRALCQLLFLMAGEPYPWDKWLPYYLEKLSLSPETAERIRCYPSCLSEKPEAQLELAAYPAYRQAAEILDLVQEELTRRFGPAQWIQEWYLYA